MNVHLLATKFHTPAPPSRRVPRANLLERLNEGLEGGRPLTLISAPAGFGKTTCASEWLSDVKRPAAWLSLDPADNDPARFFAYFVAALQRVEAGLGQELAGVLRSGQLPPGEQIAASLINSIAATQTRFVLVLDDFQVIQEQAVLGTLERLLANQPEQLHLVLVTREDPLLPLARLRANNLMTEIRAGDLRFNSQEAGRFLTELMGLALSEAEVATLENRTEGWIVGLQLAGLSMRGRPDPGKFIASLSGSHRYILSYLTEEVLTRQSGYVQTFLLQTSILGKLNGELCDALTGRSDSADLLERLFNANLFLIPLDDEQNWYRYHHLFADLLRNQQNRLPKGEVADLHRRAAQWYAAEEMAGEAIEHALAGEDYRLAVQLIEQYAWSMVMQGYARSVESWMQAIPAELRSRSPRANLAFAWMYLLRGLFNRIPPYLQQVEAALAQEDVDGQEQRGLRAEWLALQANLLHVQDRAEESLALAGQALQLAAPDDHYARGLAYLGLGSAQRQLGNLPTALEAYEQAAEHSRIAGSLVTEMLAISQQTLLAARYGKLHLAFEVGRRTIARLEADGMVAPIAGPVYGFLGIISYERNQLDQARSYMERSLQLSTLGGHNAGMIYTLASLARLHMAEGDLQGAKQFIQKGIALLEQGAPAWLKPEFANHQVRIELALGNPAAAELALAPFGISLQKPVSLPEGRAVEPLEAVYMAYLRLVLYAAEAGSRPGLLEEGIRLAGELLDRAQAGGRMGTVLQVSLLRAQMHALRGQQAAGVEDVRRAVQVAEPEGYVRTFVDEGPLVAGLLERLSQGTYVRKLLAAFPREGVAEEGRPGDLAGVGAADGVAEGWLGEALDEGPEPLIEPLTERELEVLRLMAAGLKYEEISERLVVTVNTVRFHVKGIYGKLNVNNRTKAIAAARGHGLL